MENKNIAFPDKNYLSKLSKHTWKIIESVKSPQEQLMASSGIMLNWVSDYITDKSFKWEKKKLVLDKLWLTGTNPKWNKIIIDRCEHSPKKLRNLFQKQKTIKKIFDRARYNDLPILVHYKDKKYRVLDGMYRVVAAIRDNKESIIAFVATKKGNSRPQCEPHVVYDLLRAYQRGLNKDKRGLATALRFLRKSYGNVDSLLKERFNKDWIPNKEVQNVLKEVWRK